MKTVAEILKVRVHSSIISVTPATTVLEAVTLMSDTDISALMVLDGEAVAGIITERDFVRRVARMERSSYATTVGDVMTRNLITVGPLDRSRFCMQLMIEKNLRHLPVLEDGKLVGLLSIRDLVKDVIAEQDGLINHLEQYIRGE
ncbi:MAG: CBS domain-containing protein [Pseudomonas sp.]|jgi:CBS domain-containing protein|uniref:CBS domain-containing protein n=1 Tax=Pseudomonas sp. TaxID=306 RepID=UPI000BCAFF0A|nr:CBS domain-containing protein [Pseudomonas sp.]MBT9529604.1 CBS domain-containing protein [Pseudomonas sp.]OYT96369.1 MAG: histidine kinase [Pseudomonas sp. PGPPP3]HRL94450.1 CBS domain-containing protein [Pseudomonas sp.]